MCYILFDWILNVDYELEHVCQSVRPSVCSFLNRITTLSFKNIH